MPWKCNSSSKERWRRKGWPCYQHHGGGPIASTLASNLFLKIGIEMKGPTSSSPLILTLDPPLTTGSRWNLLLLPQSLHSCSASQLKCIHPAQCCHLRPPITLPGKEANAFLPSGAPARWPAAGWHCPACSHRPLFRTELALALVFLRVLSCWFSGSPVSLLSPRF